MSGNQRSGGEPNRLAQICAGLAIGEGLLFLCIIIFEGSESDRLCSIMALGLCFAVAVGVMAANLFGMLNKRIALRRAALKALGKQGIRKIRNDEGAKYAYKGIVKMFQGKYPDADDLLQKALSLSNMRQNQLFCIEWLIKLYEATENEANMLWCFRKAAEIAPDNPEVQSRLGHAYFVDGKLSNAEYCFEQALKYDPNHGYSYYSLARLYMVRGEDNKAIDTLNKLMKIQENHPLVYADLAVIYAMHKNEEKSCENYEKAVLCGYDDPERLSKRLTAIKQFNNAENASGEDLPREYYRHIVKDETDAGNV